MSGDTHYRHHLWHIEGPTLAVPNTKLELLYDFEPPSHFQLPPNCPLQHGIRPSSTLSGTTVPAGKAPHSAPIAAHQTGVFGTVARPPLPCEEPMVSEWADIGLPPLTIKEGTT